MKLFNLKSKKGRRSGVLAEHPHKTWSNRPDSFLPSIQNAHDSANFQLQALYHFAKGSPWALESEELEGKNAMKTNATLHSMRPISEKQNQLVCILLQ